MNIRFFPAAEELDGYEVTSDFDGSSGILKSLSSADALAQQCYDNEVVLVGCTEPQIWLESNLMAAVRPIIADGVAPHLTLNDKGTPPMARLLNIDVESLPLTLTVDELRTKLAAAVATVNGSGSDEADRITSALGALIELGDWCMSRNCTIHVGPAPTAWRPSDDDLDDDAWW